MTDRLAEIKAFYNKPNRKPEFDHIYWLIDELERLQPASAEIDRLERGWLQSRSAESVLHANNQRLRNALLRLVELGEDDGSASDDAWKSAFQNAADLLGRPKDG